MLKLSSLKKLFV